MLTGLWRYLSAACDEGADRGGGGGGGGLTGPGCGPGVTSAVSRLVWATRVVTPEDPVEAGGATQLRSPPPPPRQPEVQFLSSHWCGFRASCKL